MGEGGGRDFFFARPEVEVRISMWGFSRIRATELGASCEVVRAHSSGQPADSPEDDDAIANTSRPHKLEFLIPAFKLFPCRDPTPVPIYHCAFTP